MWHRAVHAYENRKIARGNRQEKSTREERKRKYPCVWEKYPILTIVSTFIMNYAALRCFVFESLLLRFIVLWLVEGEIRYDVENRYWTWGLPFRFSVSEPWADAFFIESKISLQYLSLSTKRWLNLASAGSTEVGSKAMAIISLKDQFVTPSLVIYVTIKAWEDSTAFVWS